MISESNAASAMGGKTARACDSCAKRRARWFCAADDAFLCQSCDSSVHSANPLARRHERVRLKTASFGTSQHAYDEVCAPTWHQGFTRKARTPRHNNNNNNNNKLMKNPFAKKSESVEPPVPNLTLLVPDLGADDTTSHEENEEQLLYRVPVLDPFEATPANTNKLSNNGSWDAEGLEFSGASETKAPLGGEHESEVDNMVKGATSFLPSETELAEFAADVEVLLGKGLEQECFGMDELGLAGSDCGDGIDHLFLGDENGALRLKVKDEEEEEDQEHVYMNVDGAREPFELRFEDFDTPTRAAHGGEDGRRAVKAIKSDNWEEMGSDEVVEKKVRNKIVLRLDYEEVIAAWAGQGSPWKGGCRPEINPDDCWPDCMGGYGLEAHLSCEHGGGIGGQQGAATADGGREARVSRYREKRRTRLFSKKIRYEVRKLNAEKRPRMKGRFVKRASFLGPAAPFALLNK